MTVEGRRAQWWVEYNLIDTVLTRDARKSEILFGMDGDEVQMASERRSLKSSIDHECWLDGSLNIIMWYLPCGVGKAAASQLGGNATRLLSHISKKTPPVLTPHIIDQNIRKKEWVFLLPISPPQPWYCNHLYDQIAVVDKTPRVTIIYRLPKQELRENWHSWGSHAKWFPSLHWVYFWRASSTKSTPYIVPANRTELPPETPLQTFDMLTPQISQQQRRFIT